MSSTVCWYLLCDSASFPDDCTAFQHLCFAVLCLERRLEQIKRVHSAIEWRESQAYHADWLESSALLVRSWSMFRRRVEPVFLRVQLLWIDFVFPKRMFLVIVKSVVVVAVVFYILDWHQRPIIADVLSLDGNIWMSLVIVSIAEPTVSCHFPVSWLHRTWVSLAVEIHLTCREWDQTLRSTACLDWISIPMWPVWFLPHGDRGASIDRRASVDEDREMLI